MKLKKYLVPISTLIVAIPLASANNQANSNIDNDSSINFHVVSSLRDHNSSLSENLFQYAKGTELHTLVVKPNEIGVMLSYHRSHSSHSSHRSHYSRR